MPGLLTLRPLASAAKSAKSTAAKNAATSAAKTEKVRDDRSHAQQQQRKVSPTFSCARVMRASALQQGAPPPPQQLGPAALQPSRPKQVTDPLGEAVKENLRGNGFDISQRVGIDYSSSGSEHEPNSVCLAEMVFDYIEEDLEVGKCGRARCNCGNSCGGEAALLAVSDDSSKSSLGGEMADVLQAMTLCSSQSERTVCAAVSFILKALDDQADPDSDKAGESARGSLTRRLVMTALRSSGYNAAICKSRWEHAGGFPGGDYEYIDVILEGVPGKSERVLVDIDFKTQFEIARPTSQFSALLQALPAIYVGRADRLQQIVNIMCDAAKRSLKKKGMHLPPWRKPDYIKAKWFCSYRRTTNEASLSSSKARGGSNIAKIALRGCGWDSKFTNEMENIYHKVADARYALQECGSRAVLGIPRPAIQRKHEDNLEGQMRGANRLGLWVISDVGTGNDASVVGTEWEPPLAIPRKTQRTGKVAGLASILMEAGVTSDETRKELQEPKRQEGALSQRSFAAS